VISESEIVAGLIEPGVGMEEGSLTRVADVVSSPRRRRGKVVVGLWASRRRDADEAGRGPRLEHHLAKNQLRRNLGELASSREPNYQVNRINPGHE